jgi:serine/threonine-protein kinase
MAKQAGARYATAEDLRADLIRFRQGRAVTAAVAAPGATQAMPATTVLAGYDDPGRTVAMPAGAVTTTMAPPRRRTEAYVALLVVMLAALLVVLYLLGRQLGVFGGASNAQVELPNTIGMDAAAAEAQLKADGLQVKQNLQPNDVTEQGKVFDMDPKPGTKVDKKSLVTLLVSSGSAPAPIPNVVGQNVDDATSALEAAGFNVTTEQRQDDKRAEGTVLAQDPKAGTTANKGSSVKLTVSAGKPKVGVPDETLKDAAAAAGELRSLGLVAALKEQPSDSVDRGKVISTDPPGGTQVDKGSTVTLVVSSGSQTTTTRAPATTFPPEPTTTATTFRTTTTTKPPIAVP